MLMFKWISLVLRTWLAGGDPSRWHYHDGTGQMRRFVNGKWETRAPTEEEMDDVIASRTW